MITENRDRLLRKSEVINLTSIGSSTIYRKIAEGTFPKPRKLGPSCVRWRESEIMQWMDSLPPINQQHPQQ
jgi:prophage regulatory protein